MKKIKDRVRKMMNRLRAQQPAPPAPKLAQDIKLVYTMPGVSEAN